MSAKRLLTFCIASAIALTTLTCKDAADPVSPVDPQFAKPVKPDKSTGDPVLQEFWVVQGETVDDPDVLHIVWSGGGSAVNPSVVWDHFFNGIRDDDAPVDAHYEFYYPGPPLTLGEQLPNGWFHADIPWDGRRMNEGGYEYPDYLTTEVEDEGDPFAFKLYFYDRDKRVGVATPFGVVEDGDNTFGEIDPEAPVTTSVVGDGHDEGVLVRSFATFKGIIREGTIAITDISVSSLQCKVKAVRTGRGKNKFPTYENVVSGDVTVQFAKDPEITLENGDYIWWEGHFLDEDTGDFSTRGSQQGSGTYPFSATMPSGWTGGSVSFVIDYVVSSAATGPTAPADHLRFSNYVYDPFLNTVPTTAGFLDEYPWDDFGPSSLVIDGMFPVAHSVAISIGCG